MATAETAETVDRAKRTILLVYMFKS